MYKLFLTFRYLTRKKIVIFPVLVVWLCVMMLIIVTSIMGGFVDRVRDANRDLFGDIIISGGSSSHGFSGYDDLRAALKTQFPEIQASTPVVEVYSLVYVPGVQLSVPALLEGVNAEERSRVSSFRQSLFAEYQAPMHAVDALSVRLPATKEELTKYAMEMVQKASDEAIKANDEMKHASGEFNRLRSMSDGAVEIPAPSPNYLWLWGLIPLALLLTFLFIRILWHSARERAWAIFTFGFALVAGFAIIALGVCWPIIFPRQFELAVDHQQRADSDVKDADRTLDYAMALPADGKTPTTVPEATTAPATQHTYTSREELIKWLVPPKPSFDVPAEAMRDQPPGAVAPEGCIVGAQLGFLKRDKRGNFDRPDPQVFYKVVITVFPPSKRGNINVSANNAVQRAFTIIDDSHTGVYDVDSLNVYVPFETAQLMAGMRPDPEVVKDHPEANFDPRCHEILIRLDAAGQAHMGAISDQIRDFVDKYTDAHADQFPIPLTVQTWDEKQARYLGAVENEKTMMTFILGLMSLVVLVVIFLIFYQIVRDKTRDIGIIKAVGGSEEGVAGIFLTYGLFIGVVGGGLGILTGVLFVTHTNQIHEWIYQMTGIIIWDRSVYLFDRIPDKVYLHDVITYYAVALIAGIAGALIPAVIAGAEDPVQAVRYE